MTNLIDKSALFLKRNGSTILTCIGAAGVIATAVTAVKATPKAMLLLDRARIEKQEELSTLEKIKVAGPSYIPSILIGASTIGCIFGANVLNKQHQAALTSAYALLDNSYKEYRAKLKEIHGEEAHDRIVREIYGDKKEELDITTSDDKQLFFDFYSLQFFESTIADLRDAERYINEALDNRGYISLVEMYELLGIPCGEMDYSLGWSKSAGHKYVEFFIQEIHDGDTKHYALTMSVEPTMDYLY